MMETIIERLRKVPVCELEGQLRRVRRILPAEVAAAWRINGAAGHLRLTADISVCFQDGDGVTGAELSGARQNAPDCWQVRRRDGRVQSLRLFTPAPATACQVTVTQQGSTRRVCLPVHQLAAPVATAAPDGTEMPDGTAMPAGSAAALAGTDPVNNPG